MYKLHKRCDVYVGYGGLGVIYPPEGKTMQWLTKHCWSCLMSLDEIEAEEKRGSSEQ